MKRLLSICCMLLSALSCEREAPSESLVLPDWGFEAHASTEGHNVSFEDVSKYVLSTSRNSSAPWTKSDSKINIEPILDVDGDTLFFAVNHYPGWQLLSSDKRTPIILAESAEGTFDISSLSGPEAEWIEMLAEDIRAVKNNPDLALQNSENDDVLTFPEVWESVCNERAFAANRLSRSSTNGEYYLISSRTETEVLQEVSHLTTTRWYQDDPYNKYCPYKTGSSTERVPAGCVAVAGAQMLYYLHGRIGRPTTAPSTGYCYGTLGNYSQHFSDPSSYPLSVMGYNTIYAALLIGMVGQLVDTDYGNDESSARTEDLVEVFNGFGVSCSYGDYDENVVKSHLLDDMPVIVRANGTCTTILGIPFYSNGHAFIIDGFRQKRDVITKEYVWSYISDDPDSLGMRCFNYDDSYREVTYSTPYVSQIKINWGWGYSISTDTWYTLTGNWHVTEPNPDCDFDYRRKMIYNFNLL